MAGSDYNRKHTFWSYQELSRITIKSSLVSQADLDDWPTDRNRISDLMGLFVEAMSNVSTNRNPWLTKQQTNKKHCYDSLNYEKIKTTTKTDTTYENREQKLKTYQE